MKRSVLKGRVVVAFMLFIFIPVTAMFIYQAISTVSRAQSRIVDNAKMIADKYMYDLDAKLQTVSIVMYQLMSDTDMRTVIGDSEKRKMNGDTYLALRQAQKTVSVLAASSGPTLPVPISFNAEIT